MQLYSSFRAFVKKDNWILQLYSTDFRPICQNST